MLLEMNSWWANMAVMEKIYWIIAIPFSIIFVLQMILTFIGGDTHPDMADGHSDFTVDGDAGIHFQFISIKNLVAFFTVFGWSGLGCIHGGLGAGATIGISLFSGLLMMLIMASIFYFMGKLAESGNLNINKAIGKNATVYLTIPGSRKAAGKIQISLQGFQTLDAMTDEGSDIPTGSLVQVTGVLGNDLLLVKKI